MSLLSSPAVLRRLLLASVAANLLLAAWGPPWTPLAAAPWTPTREATPGIDLLDEAVPRDGSRPPYEADERAAWRREGVPGTRAGGGVNGPFMDVAVDLYAGLYAQHAEELRYVRRQARLFCSLGAGRCPLQDVELELTYLRLRTMKPKVVWQIAPGLGYSAVWILHALRANGNGAALHSFDAHNASLSAVPAELRGPEAAWHLHEGSAFSSYAGVLAANKSVPDYLFLDSPQRSRDFAVFYAHLIAEIVRVRAEKGRRGRVGVTLHGAYDPRSWSGRFEGRNLRVYPRWMPNEEALLLLDHIAYHLPSTVPLPPRGDGTYPPQRSFCNLHTVATSRFPRLAAKFLAARGEVLASHAGNPEDSVFASEPRSGWRAGMPASEIGAVGTEGGVPNLDWAQRNPAVFFEAGCRIKVLGPREEAREDGVVLEPDPNEEECCSCRREDGVGAAVGPPAGGGEKPREGKAGEPGKAP